MQDWPQTEECLRNFINAVRTERWFGFAEVDIEVPRELWPKFEEMLLLFYNKPVPSEAVPQHMKDYLAKSKRKPMYEQQKLVGALSAEKILLYAPLLKWYLEQGLKITAVHRTINYNRGKPFTWFVNKVTENRRKGDQNPELSLLTEVFKRLGNSAYGKMIEGLERQTTVKYTKNENILMKDLRSVWFQDLAEIGDVYEIEMRKRQVVINRPFQVGIAVYQMAKLRILQFYYDCLDRYLDRRDFELMQMDTDRLKSPLNTQEAIQIVKSTCRRLIKARINDCHDSTTQLLQDQITTKT